MCLQIIIAPSHGTSDGTKCTQASFGGLRVVPFETMRVLERYTPQNATTIRCPTTRLSQIRLVTSATCLHPPVSPRGAAPPAGYLNVQGFPLLCRSFPALKTQTPAEPPVIKHARQQQQWQQHHQQWELSAHFCICHDVQMQNDDDTPLLDCKERR